jgi:hypothetical protein
MDELRGYRGPKPFTFVEELSLQIKAPFIHSSTGKELGRFLWAMSNLTRLQLECSSKVDNHDCFDFST